MTSGSCLDDESLAAYVDGRLESSERAAVERHLTRCADCYEIFADSARFLREAEVPAAAGRWKSAAPWRGLAAALLAAAAVWLLRAGPEPSPIRQATSTPTPVSPVSPSNPSSPASSARPVALPADALTRTASLASIPDWAWEDRSASRGFASGRSAEQLAFVLGVYDTDLMVCLRRAEAPCAKAVAERAQAVLVAGTAAGARYADVRRRLAAGESPASVADALSTESPEARGLDAQAWQAGQWIEALRLASLTEDPALLGRRESTRYITSASRLAHRDASAREVADLIARVQTNREDIESWEQLGEALERLILLM